MTVAKETAERSEKYEKDLEETLTEKEEKYAKDMAIAADMKKDAENRYDAFVEKFIKKIRKEIKNKDFLISGLEPERNSENSRHEEEINLLDELKGSSAAEYNSSINNAYLTYFSQASPLIGKRIKDQYEPSNKIDPKRIEEASLGLRRLRDKHIRKEIRRGTPLGQKYDAIIKEYTEILDKTKKEKMEKEAIEKYPLNLPVLLKISPNKDCKQIAVDIPIIKVQTNGSYQKIEEKIYGVFSEIAKGIEKTEGDYTSYRLVFNNGETIEKLKESLKSRLEEKLNGAHMKVKIYTAYLKEDGCSSKIIQSPKIIPEERKEEIIPQIIINREITTAEKIQNFTPSAETVHLKPAGGKEDKKNLEDKISKGKSIRAFPNKRDLLKQEAEYLERYFDSNGKLPTIYTENKGRINFDEIKEHYGFSSYSAYIRGVLRSKKGRQVKEKIIEKLIERGDSRQKMSKMLKVVPSAIDKDLKEQGLIPDETIKRKYDTTEKVRTKQILDFTNYSKDSVRQEMMDNIKDNFSPNQELAYLGLEGPNFGSYIYFSQKCKLDSEKTTIVERNPKAYNAMKCIVRNHKKIKGGKIFENISLQKGILEKVVEQPASYGINIINLDYNGPLDFNKISTFYNLFANGYVADESVIFITLNEHPRRKIQSSGALKKKFETDDYSIITKDCINGMASEYNFKVENIIEKRYIDRKTPLLILGFKLKK